MAGGRRWTTAVLLALACAVSAVACAPSPTPSPGASSTGFASDAEAFAAAEATYRAYVDALNARNENFAEDFDAAKFLTGRALAGEIASEQQFADRGMRLTGPMRVTQFIIQRSGPIQAIVCLDVSKTQVLDVDGRDRTPPDRADRLGLLVSFASDDHSTLISDSQAAELKCE